MGVNLFLASKDLSKDHGEREPYEVEDLRSRNCRVGIAYRSGSQRQKGCLSKERQPFMFTTERTEDTDL